MAEDAEDSRHSPDAERAEPQEPERGAEVAEQDEGKAADPDDGARMAEQEAGRFRDLARKALDDGSDATGADLAAASRARSTAQTQVTNGDLTSFNRSVLHHLHMGDVLNLNLSGRRTVLPGSGGAIPEEELRRLRQDFEEPDNYHQLRQALLSRYVVVLGAAPGTGRTTTALALLDDLTRSGQAKSPVPGPDGRRPEDGTEAAEVESAVRRLPSDADLETLSAALVGDGAHGVGFLFEASTNVTGALPSEVHLDAYAAALARRGCYAIITVGLGPTSAPLLAGRYGMPCRPAPTDALLQAGLRARLQERDRTADEGLIARGEELARSAEVRAAVGLDDLRPSEVGLLADLIAEHLRGSLSRSDMLDACRGLAALQAQEWFTGLDRTFVRAGSPQAGLKRGLADLLHPAAFRIALAVLNGCPHSTVALAAHTLTWELCLESEPEQTPARSLFTGDPDSDLELSRAEPLAGTVEAVGVEAPTELVRFCGDALPTAVLGELWGRHLAARAPVVRWLRQLADDPRPDVWVRAALTVGELNARDFAHGYEELIRPLATATTPGRKVFAATALDQLARHESHRRVVHALVKDWAGSDLATLRWTAAMCLGFPRCSRTVEAALDALGRIGTRADGGQLPVASFNVCRLAVGRGDDLTTLRRLRRWTADPRFERQDLGLVGIVRLAVTEVEEVWDAETAPDLADKLDWPLALALAVARPRLADPLADLMWTALHTPRARESTVDAIETWFRAATGDVPDVMAGLAAVLPQLAAGAGEREQVAQVIERLLDDHDRPITKRQANDLWRLCRPRPTDYSEEHA